MRQAGDGQQRLRVQARSEDYERYALTLFQPAEMQPHLWALLCFSAEIARIPEIVSQEMVGLIRLAWWRERLDDAYAGRTPNEHVVVRGLHQWITQMQPPREWLDDMITARQEQLGRTESLSFAEFESFAEMTAGRLAALLSFIALPHRDQASRAIHVGTAYGMLGLVRAAPFELSQGRLLLPELAGLLEVDTARLHHEAQAVVRVIRQQAEEKLSGEGAALSPITYLHRELARWWAAKLARCDNNFLNHKLQKPIGFLTIRLLMAAMLRKS
ncbi:MAG: squalene/phytoene synthase family protein [Rickettsiales bacterium]|nr:squalene/phytoene synthase family protein [Rickettsiales bacterium]